MTKYFALVDCNNFYVSCERVFNPKLENKPVAVLSNNDGCLVARSDEVKILGIPMGAPYFKWKGELDKIGAQIYSSNYTLYGDMSQRVMTSLADFAKDIEIYSIDEAFLDLSHIAEQDLLDFAKEIQKQVKQHTGIPVSIGIAKTKTLAKIANNFAKKEVRKAKFANKKSLTEGVAVILQGQGEWQNQLLQETGVGDVWGVGRKYSKMLYSNGVFTALDLAKIDLNWVKKKMTIQGLRTVQELNGQVCFDLETVPSNKKGILSSRSFGNSVTDLNDLQESISSHASKVAQKLRGQNSIGSHLSVFIGASRFSSTNRYFGNLGSALNLQSNYTPDFIALALKLLQKIYKPGFKYKRAGVLVSGITSNQNIQTSLFSNCEEDPKKIAAMQAMDKLNFKFGRGSLKLAAEGLKQSWDMKSQMRSKRFTTCFEEILEVV